jgi:hypothetical protein
MHGTLRSRVAEAREIERNILQGTATICRPAFGAACKGIWPEYTAESLAALAGCSVRSAAYQISGEQDPSARTIQAIINLFLPPKR